MKYRKAIGYLAFIAITAGAFFSVSRAQSIIDWWKLRDYEPSSLIAEIATNSSMSEEGRQIFYVHDPQILNKDTCFVIEEKRKIPILVL